MATGPGSSGLGRPASQKRGDLDRDGSLDQRVFVEKMALDSADFGDLQVVFSFHAMCIPYSI